MVYQHNPAAAPLQFDDLYLIHRARLAIDGVVGQLGRRWGRDATAVLLLRAAEGELKDIFFSDASDDQRDAIGEISTEERRANEASLSRALASIEAMEKPA
jgi:hypothetical protein